jgi:hypothetical protein
VFSKAAPSKTWTVFASLNAGILGSNPTQGMDVYVRLFCVHVVLCVDSGLASGWSPVKVVLPTVCRINKLKKRPRSNKRTVERYIDRQKSSLNPITNPNPVYSHWIRDNNLHSQGYFRIYLLFKFLSSFAPPDYEVSFPDYIYPSFTYPRLF